MKDYFIFNSGKLKREDNTIKFINEKNESKYIPITDVDSIHLFSEINLNTKFLNLISKENIILHIYNYYGFYSGTFYSRKRNVSGILVVNQSEHYIDNEKRMFIAKAFIDSASYQILKNLRRYDGIEDIIGFVKNERDKIPLCKNIKELMGVEGNIRKFYYSAFNTILKGKFLFDKRKKRPPQDPINSILSFANTIMYTTVLSEIYKTQLDPTVSYLHEPTTKRFSLSLDIAEVFKPLIVDSVIFKLVNNNVLKEEDFLYENDICFLNEIGKKKFLAEYNKKLESTIKHRKLNRKVSYKYLIRLECYKLIKHLIGDEIYKPLKSWW